MEVQSQPVYWDATEWSSKGYIYILYNNQPFHIYIDTRNNQPFHIEIPHLETGMNEHQSYKIKVDCKAEIIIIQNSTVVAQYCHFG